MKLALWVLSSCPATLIWSKNRITATTCKKWQKTRLHPRRSHSSACRRGSQQSTPSPTTTTLIATRLTIRLWKTTSTCPWINNNITISTYACHRTSKTAFRARVKKWRQRSRYSREVVQPRPTTPQLTPKTTSTHSSIPRNNSPWPQQRMASSGNSCHSTSRYTLCFKLRYWQQASRRDPWPRGRSWARQETAAIAAPS